MIQADFRRHKRISKCQIFKRSRRSVDVFSRKLCYRPVNLWENMPEKTVTCPYCGNKESEVVETRESGDLDTIRRRRACLSCSKRFTTYERVENVQLIVIKKDGRREQLNRDKLKSGLLRASEKTMISAEIIEKIINEIVQELRTVGALEVKSGLIGEMVAKRLKQYDKVA